MSWRDDPRPLAWAIRLLMARLADDIDAFAFTCEEVETEGGDWSTIASDAIWLLADEMTTRMVPCGHRDCALEWAAGMLRRVEAEKGDES